MSTVFAVIFPKVECPSPIETIDGFAAYSVLQRLSDGTIGLLAETSQEERVRYGEISSHRFDIGELKKSSRQTPAEVETMQSRPKKIAGALGSCGIDSPIPSGRGKYRA